MTNLSKRKSKLTFETEDVLKERGKFRQVIIEAQPHVAYVRLKGMREAFPISYGAIYHMAAKIAANEKRLAKKGKK